MDALKAQLLKLQQQLTGLNASQKMLTASLVVIMIITVLWWSRYAGTSEMVPVLDQTLSAADMGRVQAALAQSGIGAKTVGDRIMVPSERKLEAVAMLAYSDALPSNIASAWDEIAKQMSPWDPQSKTDSLMNRAKEQALSAMIGNYFPGVASANVVINPVAQRLIGGSREPSATVLIKTRNVPSDKESNRLANSTASAVASAVSGLAPSKVTIVINGTKKKVQDASDVMVGSDLYENISNQERRLSDEIEKLYPGAIVAVRVDIDNTSGQETKTSYDPVKTFVKPLSEKTQTDETSQPQSQPLEPGAASNAALSISPAGAAPAAGASSTQDKSETQNQIFPTSETIATLRPGGKANVISAAVRIPRSYFVHAYKLIHGDEAKEPDSNAVQQIYKEEAPTIQKMVQTCVAMKSPENISIDMYYDDGGLQLGGKGTEVANGSSVTSLLTSHVKEIGIGALAMISLFMVSSIVKKSTPLPTILPDMSPKETPNLAFNGEEIAGIVGDGAATLDGREMDDDEMKSQQIVEQVATMVKDDPDAAANLVKRWLNRT